MKKLQSYHFLSYGTAENLIQVDISITYSRKYKAML